MEDHTSELENQNKEQAAEHSTWTQRLFSGLFGRKNEAEPEPESEVAPEAPNAYEPGPADHLGRLKITLDGAASMDGQTDQTYLLLQGQAPIEDLPDLLPQLQSRALPLLEALLLEEQRQAAAQLSELEPEAEPGQDQTEVEPPQPVDASCEVLLSQDGLTAWLFLFPPILGGVDITEDAVRQAVTACGVIYGLDEDMVQRAVNEHPYLKLLPIAQGVAAMNGKDGSVLDIIPREKKLAWTEQEDGTVDYKEYNQLNHIQIGDVICEITYPTDPTPGMNVLGVELPGLPGKPPVIPSGKNTQLNPDGTRLIAAIDGQVSFVSGKFNVDSVITISGDVDASVGNLDVVGSVIVTGDVLEGFTVRASADISVSGIVEGAKLVAGGNIQLNRGMNGNQRGVIKAKGTIIAQFLENCIVHASGDIHVQSIINSIVSCDSSVEVTKGRGVIIGGSVTACKSVEAKIIGNASHRVTDIVLGSTPDFLQQQTKLIEEVRTTRHELEELEKNLAFLERNKNIPPDQQARYNQYKLRHSVLSLQFTKKNRQLDDMSRMLENMKECFVLSNVIYPGTKIMIGLETRPVIETQHNCRVYSGPEGITFGTK